MSLTRPHQKGPDPCGLHQPAMNMLTMTKSHFLLHAAGGEFPGGPKDAPAVLFHLPPAQE